MRRMMMLLLMMACLPASFAAQTRGKEVSKSVQVTSKTAPMRTVAPSGKEIAAHFAAVRLYNEKATTEHIKGKAIIVIPVASENDRPGLGEAIAVLDTQLEGDETNLPPGKYNLFLAKVNKHWHCYAESNGRIVAEAASVSVVDQEGPEKPIISPKGWQVNIKCQSGHCSIYINW